IEGRKAWIRPIAGTRSRGATPEQDLELERELLKDPKERAEHIMMVDLARNDLGRVAKPGTVKVADLMIVERFSHVMHIVSDVQAELRPGLDVMDVVRASFPHGTMSGSPKIRAMEIIDELETVRRGPYTGALGFYSFSGDLETALLIRTLFVDGHTVHAQAAAGIVVDSIPKSEFQETEKKLKAVVRAVELAEADTAAFARKR
ncbi:MAG: anthranilate synthase component I family protein, partial [candidate division FCPU426 bacterium]